MTSTKKNLIKARRLLKGHWTQGASFRNIQGFRCNLADAECYCLTGALAAVTFKDFYVDSEYTQAYDVLLSVLPARCGPVAFNDAPERTEQEVLELLDKAIAVA